MTSTTRDSGWAPIRVVPLLFLTSITAMAQQRLGDFTSNRGPFRSDDAFGNSVSKLGDVNGDGVDDVVVGAQDEDGDNFGMIGYYGAAYVMSGSDGSVIRRHVGPEMGGRLGYQVAGGADFDADGVNDYIVASPWLPFSTQEGKAFVYSGATGAIIYSYSGEHMNDGFGHAVAILGDLDLDGVDEFAIDANFYDDGNHTQAGRVYVYSGTSGRLLFGVNGAATNTYASDVCALGDLDNDGVADFGIGSPGFGAGPNGEGTFSVYSGAGPTLLYSLAGEAHDDLFGAHGSMIGDLDGDGVPDFSVAANGHSGSAGEEGRVYVYSGSSGNLLHTYDGTVYGEGLGFLAEPGVIDLNGDGFDDISIGTYLNVAGVMTGAVYVYSGRTGRFMYSFRGAISPNGTGDGLYCVAGIGDFNHDGFDDILVGAPGYSTSTSSNEGRAYIFGGNDLFLQADREEYTRKDPIAIDLRGGAPGALAMIALVDVSGSPLFVPLALGVLDANGEFGLADTVPSGLRGFTFTFMGYAQKASGRGLADSIPDSILIR